MMVLSFTCIILYAFIFAVLKSVVMLFTIRKMKPVIAKGESALHVSFFFLLVAAGSEIFDHFSLKPFYIGG